MACMLMLSRHSVILFGGIGVTTLTVGDGTMVGDGIVLTMAGDITRVHGAAGMVATGVATGGGFYGGGGYWGHHHHWGGGPSWGWGGGGGSHWAGNSYTNRRSYAPNRSISTSRLQIITVHRLVEQQV